MSTSNLILQLLNLSLEAPPSEKVPELYSGTLASPLWFVVLNPGGKGTRPTYADLKSDPDCYTAFYRERFKDLDLSQRCTSDAYGNELSKTVSNHLEYTNAFCEGATIPLKKRWKYVMKTNRFGTHAENEEELFRCRCIYPLDTQVNWLIKKRRPAIVVTIGKAKEMLSGNDITLYDKDAQPDLPPDSTETFFIHLATSGWLTPNDTKRLFFQELGQQWKTRKQRLGRQWKARKQRLGQ